MPQSSAAIRQKADALRALRSPQGSIYFDKNAVPAPARTVWAKVPRVCTAGTCVAVELRAGALWVLVRGTGAEEAWAPALRVLSFEARREWARAGFG